MRLTHFHKLVRVVGVTGVVLLGASIAQARAHPATGMVATPTYEVSIDKGTIAAFIENSAPNLAAAGLGTLTYQLQSNDLDRFVVMLVDSHLTSHRVSGATPFETVNWLSGAPIGGNAEVTYEAVCWDEGNLNDAQDLEANEANIQAPSFSNANPTNQRFSGAAGVSFSPAL